MYASGFVQYIYSNTFATHLFYLQSHGTYICTLNLLVWPMYDTHDMNMM